jgi:hypothetical protein
MGVAMRMSGAVVGRVVVMRVIMLRVIAGFVVVAMRVVVFMLHRLRIPPNA